MLIKAIAEAQIPCIFFFCLLEGLGNPNFVVCFQLKISAIVGYR